jgi:hypothetical protein
LNDMFFKYGFRINPTLSKTNKEAYKAGDGWTGKRHTVPGVQLEVCPIGLSGEFAPDSEKSRRNQIWFCESHRHTEQRNQENDTAQVLPIFQENWRTVEINLDIVAEETSPNHYIKSGNIPLALLLEGSFHSMFENRVLPFNQTTFESVGKKEQNDCDFWRRFDKKPIG